jgi:hypothetical protein
LQHLSWCVLSDVAGTVCAARMLPHAAADSLSLCVCCALQLSVSLSRVHLALAAPRSTLSQASECHSVSRPYSRWLTVSCKLNSYTISALSLAHHPVPTHLIPPAASVGRAYLLAHLSRAHLVKAMLLKKCRCLAHKLPLAGRQAHQDHGTARRSLSIGKTIETRLSQMVEVN